MDYNAQQKEAATRLRRYFYENDGWRRQLEQLRKKTLAGYAGGNVLLRDAAPAECAAAELFLGRHFSPPNLRYSVSDFESALKNSAFALPDLTAFWVVLEDAPLLSHKEQQLQRDTEITRFFDAECAIRHGDAAQTWLKQLREQHSSGYALLLPFIGQEKNAARWLHWVCCALDHLEVHSGDPAEALAVFSRTLTTDPHALDLQTVPGRLLIQALACWKNQPAALSARQRLQLLASCGLHLDDIACFTVQQGLILSVAEGEEHPAYRAFRQRRELCLLTASQLTALTRAESPTGRAYILENQMLYSALCRREGLAHPLLCTSGQLKEASWLLLDMLAETGCELWYAGDFDPEGLGIADRLWQQYPSLVHPWRMAPEDYEKTVSKIRISRGSRLRQLEGLSCPALQATAACLATRKLAGYQEALLSDYLEDLRFPLA